MNLTIEDIENVQRQIDELKAKLKNPLQNLKKAFSEGAIIEAKNPYNEWHEECTPKWYLDAKYRIKDNISISSWNAHKDLIKQWWEGVEIEVWYEGNIWEDYYGNAWITDLKYRVKQDTWKLPEYEDGDKWIIQGDQRLIEYSGTPYTKSGRRRSTKELAERCAKASKQRDLLEAWRDYLEPEWVDADEEKVYYIYTNSGEEYYIHSHRYPRTLGTVYMGEQTAKKICDALNNGSSSL